MKEYSSWTHKVDGGFVFEVVLCDTNVNEGRGKIIFTSAVFPTRGKATTAGKKWARLARAMQ